MRNLPGVATPLAGDFSVCGDNRQRSCPRYGEPAAQDALRRYGSPGGSRTRLTSLPAAMAALDPDSLDYRDRMAGVASRHLPGRVGVHIDGFAGHDL